MTQDQRYIRPRNCIRIPLRSAKVNKINAKINKNLCKTHAKFKAKNVKSTQKTLN